MTAYAVFDCAFLVLLAATGRQDAAVVAALGWAGTCGSLAAIYYVGLRRSNRRRPAHRRELDRWALAQWTIAPMLVVLASLVFDLGFLRDTGRFLDAAGIATIVAGLGTYLSAAVDWYLILPGVSGIVRPAPCQTPGRERWARVSKLWFFHRGVATILVPFCILGLFFYMAATSEDAGTERLAWLGAIGVVGVVFYRFQHGALISIWWGLRAPRHVGDIVTLEDGTLAYTVDLAVQGINYMYLNDDRSYSGARFPHKKDGDIPLDLMPRLKPHNPAGSTVLSGPCGESADDCSPQAEWCSGVNWYCRCNPDAHG